MFYLIWKLKSKDVLNLISNFRQKLTVFIIQNGFMLIYRTLR